MAVLPLIRLNAGWHTSQMEATQEHVSDSLNVFSHEGVLLKRSGDVPVRCVDGHPVDGIYFGWGTDNALPSATQNTDVSPVAGNNTVYVGHSAPFNRAHVGSSYDLFTTLSSLTSMYVSRRGLTVEYWNGSAWTSVGYVPVHRPRLEIASTNKIHISPFNSYSSGAGSATEGVDVVISPQTDWAARSVGGNSKYWLRIKFGFSPFARNVTLSADDTYVMTTDSRVLHINVFADRNGTRHELVVYLRDTTGAGVFSLQYLLDGVVMSQSEGLQPDTSAGFFSASTKVWSFYHAATDRVIGYVSGLGYFYFLSGAVYQNSSGTKVAEIYSLEADNVGEDTPYQSFEDGLRSSLPPATVMTLHDGRIFVADGQILRWSAPGVFADIWPQSNERLLGDAGGNITGLASVGGVLVVFKRNSIWVAQSDGTDEGYSPYPIPGNVGCVAPLSVAVAGNVAYFLAEDGVYAYDGQMVTKMSGAIDGVWQQKGRYAAGWEDAVGVYLSTLNQYRLFYRSGGSANVLDAALYCDLGGYTMRTADGEDEHPVAWWRQGRYASTDYGFQATCIAVDNTSDVNRMLIGDRYGLVRTCDEGKWDGGTAVKASLISSRLGLGSARKATLRWVHTTQENTGNFDWTLKAWGDGEESTKQSNTVNPYLAADGSVFTASGAFVTDQAFSYSPDDVTVQNSVVFEGRWFQIQMLELNAAPWKFLGMELEATPRGRREY